jgi:glycosyltransferase involved in cell wall biosynthesis
MPPSHRPIRFKFVLERLLGLCNVVTFVSAALETQVKEQIRLSAPTVVLYPGVPIPTTASSCSAATGAEVVGFAGPLVWKEKASGVGLLLEAMPPLKERFPRCELWVAGSGPHLPVLVDRAKVLGVGDCVRFLGNLPSLEPFWSSVWVYAHISLQEGLPLALLEAMSFAKPTVVTGIGGIPEVVVNERNGIIVRPEASAIADAIGRLFADKDAAMRLGAEGRKTIETRFSLDRMASAAADIYGVGP